MLSFDRLIQCHIWLKRWGSSYCCFVLHGGRMHYWFYMLDGLSEYSALLILTFIANMFPLIGSFVKERRGPVLLWQWLITIISCLSIFDKPTLTQQHGCLCSFWFHFSIYLSITATAMPQFSLTIQGYIYSFSNRHSIFPQVCQTSSQFSLWSPVLTDTVFQTVKWCRVLQIFTRNL